MRRILLSLLVATLLSGSIIKAQDQLKEITLEDIWVTYKFFPKSVRGIVSLKNGEQYTMIKNGSIVVYDYKTGDSISTLINADELKTNEMEKPLKISSFSMNHDETKFLIPTETESIYRHSSKSIFYVWDSKAKNLERLAEGKQRLAEFSPDGKYVAFVRDNNLFVKDMTSKEEITVTNDGAFNHIINGTCDWVYEEEFGFTKGFYWSPDSKKIAFYKFDESRVKEYTLTYYEDLYPEWYTYKYPKAGEDNSIVNIYVYQLEADKTVKMDTGEETDQYLPRIKWTNDANILAIQRLNRLQNHLDILLADAYSGNSRVLYSEDNEYYIDITDNLTFVNENDKFLITSEKDGYNHIYLYSIEGELVKQLTSGAWDVTEVYGFDQKKKRVFYQSAEDTPLNRDIYYVDLKGKRTKISERSGTNSAGFSNNFQYYINTFANVQTPAYITVNNAKGEEVRVLEDNQKLKDIMKEYNLGEFSFFTFTSPEFTLSDGKQVELNAWKILPPDFDPNNKYPVLLTIYGGPGSQEVKNSWGYFNYFWYQMLAQKGFIIVSVDNRGTGARGELFKKMTYLELGKYETIDYIETAKYLGSLDYVDKDRIGIFGWSYGGFMASNVITQGADYFSTAVAVAPVTNWRYYDNIYTERFMRTPQENASGYDDNSPINHVEKLKGNYFLIHGSADDNVHFQNSMDMITALVKADKDFKFMVYPNKNHGIYGGNTRFYLFNSISKFLYEHMLDNE
ncbi:MAG TPA: S9 family peptidase [Bacteroidetes bacterium]|nr:S9 family peptidase [Bacteroidota bacterium]